MKKNLILFFVLLLLLAGSFYIYQNQGFQSNKTENRDFAISDTSSISRIILSDRSNGSSVTLKRTSSVRWELTNGMAVRQDAVNTLLETIKRVTVKSPVPKNAFDNVIRDLAGSSIKVEIFINGEDEAFKVYFVGKSNQQHNGSYMLLENSSVPFLMHLEGVYGYLKPRFFTNENDWKSTELFHYKFGEIKSIQVEYPNQPESGFIINSISESEFELFDSQKNRVPDVNPEILKSYVSNYRKIHFESYEQSKSDQYIDSILTVGPNSIVSITKTDGHIKTVNTYLKPFKGEDLDGNPINYDIHRFYGQIDGEDFVILQYFVFDPLIKTFNDFTKN